MSSPTELAPVSRSRAWIARETSSRGASSSTKRSPVLASCSVAPSPRIASVTRKPSRPGTPIAAVGWNCSSSRSASRAPAACASSSPTPCEPGGLVVRAHSAAAPPGREHDRACGDTRSRPPPRVRSRAAPLRPALAQQPPAADLPAGAPVRLRVRPQRARAGPLEHLYAPILGRQRRQLSDDAPSGRAAPGVHDPPDRVPTLQAQREPPEAVGVEAYPQRLQVLDARGRLVHEDLRRRVPDQLAPGALGVGEVALRGVVGGERGGEAALRPVAGRLRQWCGGDENDPRALPGGAQRRIQPSRARADDREVGLCRGGLGCPGHRGRAGGYLVRGAKPALRSASSVEGDRLVPVVVVGVVAVVVVVWLPAGAVVAPGEIVVGVPGVPGVPGVTAPVVVGTTAPPRPVAPVAPVVVVGIAPGSAGAAVVIVLVTGGGVVAVLEPPLSLTSAAASTPSASTAITAIATIGAFQFVGAARRVRAAAPQLRHHSCSGSSGAPHSGQAASTGGVGLAPGVGTVVVVGGGLATLKGLGLVDGRSRSAGPRSERGLPARL